MVRLQFFTLQLRNPYTKQVCPFLSHLFPLLTERQFCTNSLKQPHPPCQSSSLYKSSNTQKAVSSINEPELLNSLISECSLVFGRRGATLADPSLKNYLLKLSHISPETIRRFWRVSVLKPLDVYEILLGFEFYNGKFEIEVEKVGCLWDIFEWASHQSRDFMHLAQSCKIMAGMLVRVGFFEEIECLLSRMDNEGILLDCHDIFDNLIEGYVRNIELEKAISCYERMRKLEFFLTPSCYRSLLEVLVQVEDTRLAYQVYSDAIEVGLGRKVAEKSIHESVIRLLCVDGRIQEARNLIKRVVAIGIEPNDIVCKEISHGYCKKKDYDDLLGFFSEFKCAPDVSAGNKIIHSLCSDFGAEAAKYYMEKLERLGFCPDETTFGILIGWSCHEMNLKNAFIYVAEVLSRGLKPHNWSYHALIGGLFKEGMWEQTSDIFHEMKEEGIKPNISTFRVLLAGFCKARRFDDLKVIVNEMAECGLIQLSLLEDPLYKALTLLGCDPLAVRVRRDSDGGFSRTEFFDNLGNGLYLETDQDVYEKTMDKILDEAMVPDFNSLIQEMCINGDIKKAVRIVYQMAQCGQDPSPASVSTLVKNLFASGGRINTVPRLLKKTSCSIYHLDQQSLNELVQMYCKKGSTFHARIILVGMLRRQIKVENETFFALLVCLCNECNSSGFRDSWRLARKCKWVPELNNAKYLLGCLCQREWLDEAFELFYMMLKVCPHGLSGTSHIMVENLCDNGFTGPAYSLVQVLLKNGFLLDDATYNHLIHGYCKEKKFTEALAIFDIMLAKNLELPLDESVQIIPKLCRAGNFEKAFALIKKFPIEQTSAMLSLHRALIRGFCESAKVGDAANVFQGLLAQGLQPDAEVYNTLLEGYSRDSNFRKAGELLAVMIKRKLSISTSSYRQLVFILCTEGKFHRALSLKDLMLSQEITPNLFVYNIMIFYLSSVNNILLVDTLVEELHRSGLEPDAHTCDLIIQALSRSNDVSRSLQYLESMISKDIRPSDRSLREVMKSLCLNNEINKALKLSLEMQIRGWLHGTVVQNSVVNALLCRGNLREAIHFLDRMVIKGLIPDNINYDHIVKRLCQFRRFDKAVDLLNIMLKKGKTPDSTSYDNLIQGFCACHELELALDYHAEMLHRNLNPSLSTWETLTQSLCEEGKIFQAEKLLGQMVETGGTPSKEMYSCILHKYHFENNLSKAAEIVKTMQQHGYEPDFEAHWSLISNLSSSSEDNSNTRGRFLSTLLSGIGFSWKNNRDKK